MILITSAAYIESELQSEFGLLPPAFLPVGNRRLFYRQLERLKTNDNIVLTLPEGFVPGPYDASFLAGHNVKVLELPRHLRLGEAIVYALNLLEFDEDENLTILHGDTLIEQLPAKTDVIGVSQVAENYSWAEYDTNSGLLLKDSLGLHEQSLVATGFFNFSMPKKFIKHIVQANWDFIEGINGYHNEVGLSPVQQSDWCDFGHNHTYYASKSKITTQRAFNEMQIADGVVTKRSKKIAKLQGEALWYENIPGKLKLYTPQFLQQNKLDGEFEYSIEYLHLTALNELFVFSQLPVFAWRKIINACCQFVRDCQKQSDSVRDVDDQYNYLFKTKTLQRIQEYADDTGFDVSAPINFNGQEYPGLLDLARISQQYLPEDKGVKHIMHGDFCFSNILYDFRASTIKVIDPRGIDLDNKPSIYGNSLYDIAKLAHSILGLYDVIVAGYFEAQQDNSSIKFNLSESQRRDRIAKLFVENVEKQFGISEVQLHAMQLQLFLSMLPLHADRPDRQLGFIGNAYRLFEKLQTNIS